MKDQIVLVTTEFRGVFCGQILDDSKLPSEITLLNARNCIYWTGVGGFLGLAASGPKEGCRIGALVDQLQVFKITSVTPLTSAEAITRWKEFPTWK